MCMNGEVGVVALVWLGVGGGELEHMYIVMNGSRLYLCTDEF